MSHSARLPRPLGMDIAITGGTGTLGRRVAEELRARGHHVRALSRRAPDHPVDLRTGTGLEAALEGCDVVVDASNDKSSTKGARRTLVDGTARLLAAAGAAGVRHHVCVSIVNCDEVPVGYLQAKADQERLVERSRVPWTIVRATQFHEFVVSAFLEPPARWGVLPLPSVPLQPVATVEVARLVADTAEGAPRRGLVEMTGPQRVDIRELGRVWRRMTGRRVLQLPVRLPGAAGAALRRGTLTTEGAEVRGATGFADWLAAQRGARVDG